MLTSFIVDISSMKPDGRLIFDLVLFEKLWDFMVGYCNFGDFVGLWILIQPIFL